ncbi:MAG: glycosyltransferase, partial [Bryobacteraceae bacterium]
MGSTCCGISRSRKMPRWRLSGAWATRTSWSAISGRTAWHMHWRTSCQAAALVKESGILFLFVGTGAARSHLVAEAERRGLHNVRFVPAQPKETMPTMWAICDVALVHLRNVPLFRTVIPSKIFEAMAMGLPILLTAPDGEASAIVVREGAGICLPAEEPQALAEAVLRLNENRRLLRQLADHSKSAAPRYSRDLQARKMLLSFRSALSAGPQAPQCHTETTDTNAPNSGNGEPIEAGT